MSRRAYRRKQSPVRVVSIPGTMPCASNRCQAHQRPSEDSPSKVPRYVEYVHRQCIVEGKIVQVDEGPFENLKLKFLPGWCETEKSGGRQSGFRAGCPHLILSMGYSRATRLILELSLRLRWPQFESASSSRHHGILRYAPQYLVTICRSLAVTAY